MLDEASLIIYDQDLKMQGFPHPLNVDDAEDIKNCFQLIPCYGQGGVELQYVLAFCELGDFWMVSIVE